MAATEEKPIDYSRICGELIDDCFKAVTRARVNFTEVKGFHILASDQLMPHFRAGYAVEIGYTTYPQLRPYPSIWGIPYRIEFVPECLLPVGQFYQVIPLFKRGFIYISPDWNIKEL